MTSIKSIRFRTALLIGLLLCPGALILGLGLMYLTGAEILAGFAGSKPNTPVQYFALMMTAASILVAPFASFVWGLVWSIASSGRIGGRAWIVPAVPALIIVVSVGWYGLVTSQAWHDIQYDKSVKIRKERNCSLIDRVSLDRLSSTKLKAEIQTAKISCTGGDVTKAEVQSLHDRAMADLRMQQAN